MTDVTLVLEEKKMEEMSEIDRLCIELGIDTNDSENSDNGENSNETTSDVNLAESLKENESGYIGKEKRDPDSTGESLGRRMEDILTNYILDKPISPEVKKYIESKLREHYFEEAVKDNENYEAFENYLGSLSEAIVDTKKLEKYGTRFLAEETKKIREEKGLDYSISLVNTSDITYKTNQGDIVMKAGERLNIDRINAINYLNGQLMGSAVEEQVSIDKIIHSPLDFRKKINQGEKVTLFEIDLYKHIIKNIEKEKRITFKLKDYVVLDIIDSLKKKYDYNQEISLKYSHNLK